MIERAITFGGGRLLGVLTEPSDENREEPCLVILNAGLIHRVGPGRLSVDIARGVAATGFSAFRFDLSGLGDTEPRVPPSGVVESAVADVREALDYLGTSHGFRTFVLLGLCSGAIHAHHATLADDRIRGAVLLDGYSFPTLRFHLGAVADRLRSPSRLLQSVVHRAVQFSSGTRSPLPDEDDAFLPRTPPRHKVEADLGAMVGRGVQLLCVFSGEWRRVYRYKGQLREAFASVPFGSTLTEGLIPGAEHLFFTPPERAQVIDLLGTWLRGHFSEPGGRRDAPGGT